MPNKFQSGQIVELMSGGPAMTVEHYVADLAGPSSTVSCTWFNGRDVKRERFHEDSLRVVEPFDGPMVMTIG